MKGITFLSTLFLLTNFSFAENKGAISASVETNINYFSSESDNWSENLISMVVSLNEDGSVVLDEFDYMSAEYERSFNHNEYEIDAKILGLYIEDISSQVGSELGL